MKVYVMLAPGLTDPFRRSVRDKKNEVREQLVFQPNMPVLLSKQQQLDAVADDIGAALVIAECKEKEGEIIGGKANWEETAAVVREIAQAKLEAKNQTLLPHQRAVIDRTGPPKPLREPAAAESVKAVKNESPGPDHGAE